MARQQARSANEWIDVGLGEVLKPDDLLVFESMSFSPQKISDRNTDFEPLTPLINLKSNIRLEIGPIPICIFAQIGGRSISGLSFGSKQVLNKMASTL